MIEEPYRNNLLSFPSSTWERKRKRSSTSQALLAKGGCEVELREQVRSQVELGNEEGGAV